MWVLTWELNSKMEAMKENAICFILLQIVIQSLGVKMIIIANFEMKLGELHIVVLVEGSFRMCLFVLRDASFPFVETYINDSRPSCLCLGKIFNITETDDTFAYNYVLLVTIL